MASQLPPPVVDSDDYVTPPLSGDDFFLRRSSWNAAQIHAEMWKSVPAPQVVDQSDYVPSSTKAAAMPKSGAPFRSE